MSPAPLITDSAKAAQHLQDGRLIAFPTGTSYGLAADTLQGNALQRLRNIKMRPVEKSFTVFVKDELLPLYFNISSSEAKAIERYRGQAVTILLKPTNALAHLAQNGRVGLRLIDHPLMAALAKAYPRPLTATSANRSGQDPCLTPQCIQKSFPGEGEPGVYDLSLAAILDGGPLKPSLPSTIMQVDASNTTVIRPGAVVISRKS